MSRFYLISKESWFQRSIHPVECPISIGRRSTNDLQIRDPSVSRQHARIVSKGKDFLVEDLGSQNGTLVNGRAVEKYVLNNGDTLMFGNVSFEFVADDPNEDELSKTEIFYQVFQERKTGNKLGGSIRLKEAIAKVPLFMDLPVAAREEILRGTHLRTYEPTEFIFKEGDRGRSLFVILDGAVEIFTQDYHGTPIPIARLGANSFFGERAILTGKPRCASAVATEETLICELFFSSLKRMLNIKPQIRSMLEEYSKKRFKSYVFVRDKVGFPERRQHARLNEELKVKLHIASICDTEDEVGGDFIVISNDISLGGMKLAVPGKVFRGIECLGKQVRLEVKLPDAMGEVRSLGIIRNVQVGETEDNVILGVEFYGMGTDDLAKLERFLHEDNII